MKINVQVARLKYLNNLFIIFKKLLKINKCVDNCGDKYYPSISSGLCLNCDPSCLSCFGPHSYNCLACGSPNYFY